MFNEKSSQRPTVECECRPPDDLVRRVDDFDLPEDFGENIREILALTKSFGGRKVDGLPKVINRLMDSLVAIRNEGYSFQEIANCLRFYKIPVSTELLIDYFHADQERRLAACERHIRMSRKPEWNAAIERIAFIESKLRNALKNDKGLLLHYQPQIDMISGRVVGAEALVWWKCEGTIIHPSEFIPIAEGSGLIEHIGEWVLREACLEAKRWNSMGLGGEHGLKIGVNLSVKQFSEDLPNTVHHILCDTGLPTRLLGLEITESFLVGEGAIDVLRSLRDSGICLSVDDFGTGYSCLSQLKNLPIDVIKIDRSFVQDLGREWGSAVMIEAIINMAKNLGMATLAEGVENEVQVKTLCEMGCSVGQGFLYSRPVAGNAFVEFVRGRE